eukprot:7864767-Alexandrium_andersonii.AAC.1
MQGVLSRARARDHSCNDMFTALAMICSMHLRSCAGPLTVLVCRTGRSCNDMFNALACSSLEPIGHTYAVH